ncbi:GntR family transcriptional regulator [Serinicoccus profundi]|uniref:GntR family transcriptional regulator n=1 Tax=Serinicoccus profundi TaxID=1078471 RepID=UPI000255EAF7|nr:GntR family transcriptional regulator [Serinicoccus profundi]
MGSGAKAEEAYSALEELIVFQRLEPGSLVSEAQLTELTGLGRTPIREALQRLARHRMVHIYPNRGVLIPATSVEEQLRLLELRLSLEELAVRLACERATESDRRPMEQMASKLDRNNFTMDEYAGTVRDTHGLIVRAAHNDYLADAIAPLQGLSRRFWFAHVQDIEVEIHAGARLHRAILTAILRKDVESAEEAVKNLNTYLVEFAYATIRLRSTEV